MNWIDALIGTPLGALMWLCYTFLRHYGWAIVLFTVLTKLILFPLSLWVQKNSIKMVKLQPQVNDIAVACGADHGKAAEEQLALYKKEGYHPMAGVIPMLIQIPIILGLISVVYSPLKHLLRLDPTLIQSMCATAEQFVGAPLGSTAQLKAIELIKDPSTVGLFSALGGNISHAIESIQQMNFDMLGLNLVRYPSFGHPDIYWLFPILSGLSALLLCVCQNRENVLQREQGFWGRWGVTIFLTAFSTYFAFIVPAGIGLYWILGNLIAIFTLYLLNWIDDPKKAIDYAALEQSKQRLAESRAAEKSSKPTPEQVARGKADYKRFCDDNNVKQLVYYSEKSGFYKYFADQIDQILKTSDLTIHYLTSDPNDAIFEKNEPRIVPYYVGDNSLIPLFMKMDCNVMVSTTPNLHTYHLKRSLVRKDIEYIYTPHDPMSLHMGTAKGAYDHFDTMLCVGPHQVNEARALEKVYQLKEKTLVPCGYAMIDNLLRAYEGMEHTENKQKKILIAPSWQEGNILESCIDALLSALLGKGYDVTVRPHPEFVKRFPAKMMALTSAYKDQFSDSFRIEADFSSNVTIFTADLVITDWSGIAYEFSYATKKPCLFIDTPMKIMNPEYEKIDCVPIEIALRNHLGIALPLDKAGDATDAVHTLLTHQDDYRQSIAQAMEQTLFNPGHSAEVAAQYIVAAVSK